MIIMLVPPIILVLLIGNWVRDAYQQSVENKKEKMIMANQYPHDRQTNYFLDELLEIAGDHVCWYPYNEWGAYKFCVLVPFSKLQKFVDICNQLFDFEGRVPASIQGDSIFIDLTDYASEYYDELNKKIESSKEDK